MVETNNKIIYKCYNKTNTSYETNNIHPKKEFVKLTELR